jgi:hypothetical protein
MTWCWGCNDFNSDSESRAAAGSESATRKPQVEVEVRRTRARRDCHTESRAKSRFILFARVTGLCSRARRRRQLPAAAAAIIATQATEPEHPGPGLGLGPGPAGGRLGLGPPGLSHRSLGLSDGHGDHPRSPATQAGRSRPSQSPGHWQCQDIDLQCQCRLSSNAEDSSNAKESSNSKVQTQVQTQKKVRKR